MIDIYTRKLIFLVLENEEETRGWQGMKFNSES